MKIQRFVIPYFFFSIALLSCASTGETEKTSAQAQPVDQQTRIDTIKKDHAEQGFDLLKNESIGTLKIGQSLNEVQTILGEPVSKTELENWGADGRYYSTYNYSNGLSLNMGSDDSTFNGANISSITASGNCSLKTGKGIGIGSTFEETKNAYQSLTDQDESNDSILVAGSVYGGLIFNFKNGKVNRFFLGAAAE